MFRNNAFRFAAAAATTDVHAKFRNTPTYQAISRQVSDRRFDEVKKEIIADLESNKNDKSIAGQVDARILEMVNLINSKQDYFTTSSCSGRISVFHRSSESSTTTTSPSSPAKKRGTGRGFLYVTHDPLETSSEKDDACDQILKTLNCGQNQEGEQNFARDCPHGTVELKYEPLILHVRCRNLEASQQLLEAASLSGLRKSGMIAPSVRHPILPDEREMMRVLTMTNHEENDNNNNENGKKSSENSGGSKKSSNTTTASLLNYVYGNNFLVSVGSTSGVNNIIALEGKMFTTPEQLRELIEYFNDDLLMKDNEKRKELLRLQILQKLN